MTGRFRTLLVVGLVGALAGSAWAECLSGDLTPEQQACCTAMNHDCGAAGVEMGCCPTEPPPPDRLQAAAIEHDVPAPAPVSGPAALPPEPYVRLRSALAASFDRETLKLPDRPTYLLLSVFLI
jgi:hypothetical protein